MTRLVGGAKRVNLQMTTQVTPLGLISQNWQSCALRRVPKVIFKVLLSKQHSG